MRLFPNHAMPAQQRWKDDLSCYTDESFKYMDSPAENALSNSADNSLSALYAAKMKYTTCKTVLSGLILYMKISKAFRYGIPVWPLSFSYIDFLGLSWRVDWLVSRGP